MSCRPLPSARRPMASARRPMASARRLTPRPNARTLGPNACFHRNPYPCKPPARARHPLSPPDARPSLRAPGVSRDPRCTAASWAPGVSRDPRCTTASNSLKSGRFSVLRRMTIAASSGWPWERPSRQELRLATQHSLTPCSMLKVRNQLSISPKRGSMSWACDKSARVALLKQTTRISS